MPRLPKKNDFPFFTHNPHCSYLDNAATKQKPACVLDALNSFYSTSYSPVQRSIYATAETATQLYENARACVASFIGAESNEVAFTQGTTESINLLATALKNNFSPGDQILLSQLEHHANMVPWQQLAHEKELSLVYIPVTNLGELDLTKLPELVTERTKLIAITHCSNVTGAYTDVQKIVIAARTVGALVFLDAAQSIAHIPLDTQKLGIDFMAFSGHKLYGPTGIGVLYARTERQKLLEPYQTGGSMVFDVDYFSASWKEFPTKFEAGTPPVAAAIGLGAALDYFKTFDFKALQQHEAELCALFIAGIKDLPGITLLGNPDTLAQSGHLVSFALAGYHPHDIAAFLDMQGICVRAGHQCAQPLHKKWALSGSVRVSFALYSTREDVHKTVAALRKLALRAPALKERIQ